MGKNKNNIPPPHVRCKIKRHFADFLL